MGYILCRATTAHEGRQWQQIAFYIVVANAPDLDFIPGFVIGQPNRYHHGISHSLGLAALVSVFLAGLHYLRRRGRFGQTLVLIFMLYSSHLGLDYLSTDTSPPHGLPLFWPISDAYHIAPFAFFPDIQRISDSSGEFIRSLFSLHNLKAACLELLILSPLLLLILALRRTAREQMR